MIKCNRPLASVYSRISPLEGNQEFRGIYNNDNNNNNTNNRTAFIIDIAIPGDSRLTQKVNEKCDRNKECGMCKLKLYHL